MGKKPGAPGAKAIEQPREAASVLTPEQLAKETVPIAIMVEQAVYEERKRADRTLAEVFKKRRDLAPPDQRFISAVVFSMFRWRGWVEPLVRNQPYEARVLISTLLDSPTIPGACRVWARKLGRDPMSLIALGAAPSWAAKVTGLKRVMGGRAMTGDPWRLFPESIRELIPLPPGAGAPKIRLAEFLRVMQSRPPLWLRAQGAAPEKVWDELRGMGLKPWVHRRMTGAAHVDAAVDVYHLPAFLRGELEIQDLASQAVALACDPEPGERWWDVCAGAGGKSIHLAALMGGKGTVIATDRHQGRLKETVRRARKSPFRNLSTREWDGKHVAGKSASYDGVLVDAPCSALGTWRRNPDARWVFDPECVARLAETQARLLALGGAGVKVGGTLVYSVCTPSPAETVEIVRGFLEKNPGFRLDPFPHPLSGEKTTGSVIIWPDEGDSDLMFIARMIRVS